MKLTNTDRDAFVTAVMQDVPSVNYVKMAQEAIRAYDRSLLCPNMQKAVVCKDIAPFLQHRHSIYFETLGSFGTFNSLEKETLPEPLRQELNRLAKAAKDQGEARRQVREKLRGAIYGCNTLKQAQARLPEFEKYLPADRESTGATNLPVIANLVGELTRLGWPKGVAA